LAQVPFPVAVKAGAIVLRTVAVRLVVGLFLTALSVRGGARLAELVAAKGFGATDTLYLQWTVAIVIALLGLLSTFYKVKEACAPPQASSR
jgi:hypothetical protein